MATEGFAVANEETGDVAFGEALVKIDEQVKEPLVGPATGAIEQVDEGIENDKFSVDTIESVEEASEVCWEGEGVTTTHV